MKNPFIGQERPNLFSVQDEERLKSLSLQTGDIFFRSGNSYFYGIPFSFIVSLFTHSKFSHASICLIENNEIHMVEIDENGVRKSTVSDWLSYCAHKSFLIYRLKEKPLDFETKIKEEIYKFLERDPLYDYTFNDENKFYCTESVVFIYKQCGLDIFQGYYAKELMPWFLYQIFKFCNKLVGIFTNGSIPENTKGYFVGNEEKGMIASKDICRFYEYL